MDDGLQLTVTTTAALPVLGPGLSDFRFPRDRALFVVGDVHGQKKMLATLLDAMGRLPASGHRHLVFLGDLIDRGPDTLLAAGLGVKGALLATQGREEVWEPRGDRDAWRALDGPAREELARLEAEDGRYAAIVAEVSAIAEALRADAVARLPVLRRRRDAHLAQAEVDFVQAL